jgi:hypothetical protein
MQVQSAAFLVNLAFLQSIMALLHAIHVLLGHIIRKADLLRPAIIVSQDITMHYMDKLHVLYVLRDSMLTVQAVLVSRNVLQTRSQEKDLINA